MVILASCAILVFLWKGAQTARDRGEPAKFWKTVVFRDMAAKVITICSADIRVSIGLHISLVAAAVAALMLETTGTRFRDIAAVSIQRASGSSPYTILPALLRVDRASVFGVLHASIILIWATILIALTFTSTILLTDLKNANIAEPMQTKLLPIGLGPNTTLSANGVLHYRPSPFANWRFGEMKSGDVTSTAEIADTGSTYRALLPYMKEESRTSLEHYTGPGLVDKYGRSLGNSFVKEWYRSVQCEIVFCRGYAPELHEITITGMAIPSEPTVEWQRNGPWKSSQQLRKQLGIGVFNKDYRRRHIMQLEIGVHDSKYSKSMAEYKNFALEQALLGYPPQGGWAMTNYKDLYEEDWIAWWAAHAVHVSLIQDILRATGDPALAIQALAFRFHSMIFYDSMADFDLQKPVTTINSAEMLLPVRWKGLAVVLGLALVHLLLLCSTMVLFQFKTRASSLGNAWQATAQVVSTETRAVVEEASAVRDKEVEAWARSSGVSRRSYTVMMSDVRNRTEIVDQKM
ncbi:hypothetical protein QSH57_015730 [Fusarium oxysporum f. sp. vasinfectum]|nr:hypothetical protein QSH57_015730 [Fusarium oxysporum f. sp. vasinfectum]